MDEERGGRGGRSRGTRRPREEDVVVQSIEQDERRSDQSESWRAADLLDSG